MEPVSIMPPAKKRKNKDDDHKSSKKRKHHDGGSHPSSERKKKDKSHRKHKDTAEKARSGSLDPRKPLSDPSASQSGTVKSNNSSPFHLVTTTIYLPLSPISISPTHALPSLLSEHIAPMLLTYYPPVRGIILAFSNPSISSTLAQSGATAKDATIPQQLTLATTAGEYGVLYVYLTITFLVFRPERGQTLEGWINVQSEGFLGAVVLNLFSVGIERKRLPLDWKWIAPGEEPAAMEIDGGSSEIDSDKENFRPLKGSEHLPEEDDDESAAAMGYFQTSSGKRVRGTIKFRVRDVDVIPGSEQDKGFISLEGTMLNPEEEAKLVQEEKNRLSGGLNVVDKAPDHSDDVVMISGGLVQEEHHDEPATETTAKEKKKKKKTKSKA